MSHPQPAPTDVVAPSLDRYARMVRRALAVPVALVTIVEDDRQVFPGAVGLPEEYMQSRQTPLTHSFCQYVVRDDEPLVINDARVDDRLRDNLAIPDLGVVAYAGWPLRDHTGRTIGSVCAIDTVPRAWTQADLDALEDLAVACSTELVQRRLRRQAGERAQESAAVSTSNRLLLALSERLATTRTIADVSVAVEQVARRELGCLHAGVWLRLVSDPMLVRPARSPQGQEPAEPLTFVHNPVTDWTQATLHASLGVCRDNPLGEAMLSHGLVVFGTRAEQNARYPHLETPAQAGETRAYMPLDAGSDTYGALALVWPERRELTDDDRHSIVSLRSYTAQAIQRALLLQERVDVGLTLQNAMLTRLPQPDRLTLAARYRPAGARDQVGGDWYDAVVLSDASTHLMVGDVVGHDIRAAAVMGQLRSMLRTFAWTHPEDTPARLVERLDRASDELGLGAMATLVHARIGAEDGPCGTGARTVTWTNAGHPPALLAHDDGTVDVLGADHGVDSADPLLGAAPERDRTDHTRVLPPGATLLLYTDGLIERRGEHLDAGIDRARDAVARHRGEPLDGFLDGVLCDLVGDDPDDDVVVLAVRVPA